MASELRVNTLKDASGNNSVATSVVFNGTSKVWAGWNTITSTSILDSYNVSSLTDNGTAYTTINITSNMSSTGYALTASAGTASYRVCLDTVGSNTDLTGSCNTYATRTDTGAGLDFDKGSAAIHGDLA